jgi:hypothetical protein
MADEANPLHPNLPPEQADDAPANPEQSEAQPDQPAAEGKPTEAYIKKLTGGRYKSVAALAKAKQETDRAYHEEVGRRKALEEMASHREPVADNQPSYDEVVAHRLEEQGIDASVVGVFQDMITQTVRETLEPIARSQQERARALGDNPQWASDEAEMFNFLAQFPEEQDAFNQLHATNPQAAYRYGMRGLTEYRAGVESDAVEQEAVELEGEMNAARTHGQVIPQRSRGTVPVKTNTDVRDGREEQLWQQGLADRSTDEYMNERLKDGVLHPKLKEIEDGMV